MSEKSTGKKSKDKTTPKSSKSFKKLIAECEALLKSQRNPVDEAQDIIYDAWEASTRQRAVELAKKALSIFPDCSDAYTLLAQETAKTIEEALALYQKGVEAGERGLGKKAFKNDVGYFWGLIETRPYMRARAGLALTLWEAGRHQEAVEHYWELLRLNPDDNQGNRHLMMPCLIEFDRDAEAEKLYKQYEEDGLAVWRYSRALLDFRKRGDSPRANKSLKEALAQNAFVPAYLLGKKRMPRALPEHYGFGDANEAVLFVHYNKTAWKNSAGALDWLADQVK